MRFAGTQLTNFIDPTNFDAIGKSSINGQSVQNQALMQSEAYVDRADIQALADIESAKFGASATRAQGAAAGQSAMFSGLSSGISSLAGGIGGGGSTGLSGLGANSGLMSPASVKPMFGQIPTYTVARCKVFQLS